jgi:hypothetical protein
MSLIRHCHSARPVVLKILGRHVSLIPLMLPRISNRQVQPILFRVVPEVLVGVSRALPQCISIDVCHNFMIAILAEPIYVFPFASFSILPPAV